jgi:recombination protein RecT
MTTPTALTVTTPKELLGYLSKSRSAIEMALPKHLNPDRMMRLALTCFSTNPALRECSAQSILSSIVVASQLGLEPGIAGQGYLIPYKTTCTFVPGWQGLVGLLNNTGRATAWTGAVFDGDDWQFELGSTPRCRHIPGPNYGDVDKLTWVYACGQVNGSQQPVIEAWPVSRVKKHRDKFNKVGPKHYSVQNFEMYARKVVLLQVLKYMPRSIELNNAIAASNADESGRATVVDNGVVIEMPEEKAPIFQREATDVQADEIPGAESPKEKKSEKAPPAESVESLQQGLERLLSTESAVKFDDFRDFIGTKNISKDADSWPSWAEVPDAVCQVLAAQPKTMAELIRKFGKVQGK